MFRKSETESGNGNEDDIELIDKTYKSKPENFQEHPSTETDDTGNVHHGGAPPITRFVVLVPVILVLFLGALDALPTISASIVDEFDSLPDLGWYASAYTMANMVMLPLSGVLYANFSSRWTMIFMLMFQQAGILVCGFASSSLLFICGRVISGIGGGGIPVGALVIIDGLVPKEQRPVFTASTIGFSQLGLLVGPVIGGLITQKLSWRWTYFYRAPGVAIAIAALTLIRVPEQVAKPKLATAIRKLHHTFDLVGLFLILAFIVPLLFALELGKQGWTDVTVLGLLGMSAISGPAFAVWNVYRGERALMPVSMLKHRHVYSAMLFGMAATGAMIPTTYFIPLYIQSVLGASPLQSAAWIMPATPVFVVVLIITGILVQKTGSLLLFVIIGNALSMLGSALLSTMSPSTKPILLVIYECVAAAGRGLIVQAPTTVIQFTLPGDQVSFGHAILLFSQTLTVTIVSTVTNLLFQAVLRHKAEASATASNYTEILVDGGATEFRTEVAEADLPEVLQIYSQSINSTFYVALGLGAVALVTCLGMKGVEVRKPAESDPNKVEVFEDSEDPPKLSAEATADEVAAGTKRAKRLSLLVQPGQGAN